MGKNAGDDETHDPQNRRDLSGVHGNIIGNHSFFNSDLVVS